MTINFYVRIRPYAYGILIAAGAVYIQWLTHFWLGTRFIVFYPLIILTAYLFGSGPAAIVAATSVIAAIFNFISFPGNTSPLQIFTQCLVFSTTALLIILLNRKTRESNDVLRIREEEFRGLFEQSSVGMVFTDPRSGRITRANQAFAAMLGYEVSEMVGRTFMEFTHPEDWAKGRESHFAISKGKISNYLAQKRYLHKDGSTVWAEIVVNLDSSSRTKTSSGRILAIVQDITNRKRLEEHLEKAKDDAEAANRSKDLFLATVSHELRTPLTTIQMWSQMMQEGRVSAEKMPRAIEAIEQNSRILNQLIGDLLDFSGIKSGKFVLNKKAVSLDDVLAESIATVELFAQSKFIQIKTDFATPHTTVLADPMRLKQILWNLLVNAIKFSNRNESVLVRSRHLGDECEIQVVDNGRGIAPEFLPKLFEQFTQADSTSIRRQGGIGLGLAIVRDLVQLHKGTVTADSPGLGKGATLTIRLPAERQKSLRPASTLAKVKISGGSCLRGHRILFVDDSVDTREVVEFALESMGAEVKIAESAREALSLLPIYRPTVIVSDISMPDEDGYSLINKVRALPSSHGGKTPAIALTAHASAEDGRTAREAGFEVHLSKPVNWAMLVRTILELCRVNFQERSK